MYNVAFDGRSGKYPFMKILQTLSNGKSRFCSTVIGRIAAFCFAIGKKLPDEETGNYCKVTFRPCIILFQR